MVIIGSSTRRVFIALSLGVCLATLGQGCPGPQVPGTQQTGTPGTQQTQVPKTQRTLTLNKVGSGLVLQTPLLPSSGTYEDGTQVLLAAMDNANWQFDHWEGDLSGSTFTATIVMNGDKTVTAVFTEKPKQYTLTIKIQGQGSVTRQPDQAAYDLGTRVTLTATAASGWQFSSWGGVTSGSTNPIEVAMYSNSEVTAFFTELPPVKYTLTVLNPGNGNAIKDPDLPSYDPGAVVTLTPSPAGGYRFDHWEGDLTGTANPASITMDGNKTVTPAFIADSGNAPVFYAVYDPIVDAAILGDRVTSSTYYNHQAAMSSVGNTLAFTNGRATNRKVYVVDKYGKGLTPYTLPDGVAGISWITINSDGRRIFAADPGAGQQSIYKIETGQITRIPLDTAKVGTMLGKIWAEDDANDWVYFQSGGHIWRIRHDGSGYYENILDFTKVACSGGGSPQGVEEWDISTMNNITVGFTMSYWLTNPSGFLTREVFSLLTGVFYQLTDDRKGPLSKGSVVITPDGNVIVYQDLMTSKHMGIHPHPGGGDKAIIETGQMDQSIDLTGDPTLRLLCCGNMAFAYLYTGSMLELLPPWLPGHSPRGMGGGGVFFRHLYDETAGRSRLYFGHLNDSNAVPKAPQIKSVRFAPPVLSKNDPKAQSIMTIEITDIEGLSDINRIDVFEMVNGRMEGNATNLPAVVSVAPRDDGKAPDLVAGDGLYTTICTPGAKIGESHEARLRVAVEDKGYRNVVADYYLPIGW